MTLLFSWAGAHAAQTYSNGQLVRVSEKCSVAKRNCGYDLVNNHIEYVLAGQPNTRAISPGSLGIPGYTLVALEDLNADGHPDYVFQHTSGLIVYWLMNTFNPVSGFVVPGSEAIQGYHLVAVKDISGDGKPDFLFQHDSGIIVYWYMTGNPANGSYYGFYGGFIGGSEGLAQEWRLAGVADMNTDGKADLIFQNTTGLVVYWYMNGVTVTGGVVVPGTAGIPGYRLVTIKDLNGDGRPDFIFQHLLGTVVTWKMSNTAYLSGEVVATPYANGVTKPIPGSTITILEIPRLVGGFDINKDGLVDLIFQF